MPPTAATDNQIRDAAETLSRESLHALQLERLRATADRVLAAQPRGAQRLRDAGIAAGHQIDSLDDLGRIPFTTKGDLHDAYPFGLLAVPRSDVVRIHGSSGTHGKPTLVAYTRGDLETWTELMARGMAMAGVRSGMKIHNSNGYGLFTGGLGFHQGGERLGATVVPVSGGRTARQVMLLSDLGSEVLVATPSYALVIAQAVRESGIDPASLALELGLFGGEPWSEPMRGEIERALGIRAINFYGLSEMCGPGVATECLVMRAGLHVSEDHFLVEVVEPGTERPVVAGEEGELVFTTLTKEALPLIRYRTGDIGRLISEQCGCGRTTVRLTGLRGRVDDMLIIRGVNLYPSSVEHALLSVKGAAGYYRLIVDRPGAMDELTLECEPTGERDRDSLRAEIEHALREQTGLRIEVAVVEPGTLPRSDGKAVRVVDRRPSAA